MGKCRTQKRHWIINLALVKHNENMTKRCLTKVSLQTFVSAAVSLLFLYWSVHIGPSSRIKNLFFDLIHFPLTIQSLDLPTTFIPTKDVINKKLELVLNCILSSNT